MNNGDTDDTEIVSGDEDDLPPIYDIAVGMNDDGAIESAGESIPVEQSDELVHDGESNEQQPPAVQEPLVLVETVSESAESAKVKPQPSGWERARKIFFGSPSDVTGRLNNLTQAIEDAPESAVNYVLRADVYMELREYALAQADFQRAFELAETEFELADWGILDQVMRDRALTGLEKVQRRLR